MAFGQASGPPARAKQLEELLALLRQAGHSDFRDARGPMGFNQRQAAGKFTQDEATVFIEQLEAARDSGEFSPVETVPTEPVAPPPRVKAPSPRLSTAEQTLRKFPSSMLAAELQRRGWVVMEP